MKELEYTTKRGNRYMISYRLVGVFLWEWDVCLYSPAEGMPPWLGLTFGRERTLRPKKVMKSILVHYSEYKDRASEK